jgi:hypothetical protein
MTKPELLAAVLDLPVGERAALAVALIRSIDTPDSDPPVAHEEWEELWAAEVGRRIREWDAGEVKGVPAAQALADARRRLMSIRRAG